ncbi:MAG TPA: hypothetical protein QGF05_14215 [Dehalococcoidia bacterium]|nr:hypothetical protein [Dehalococcoidia bacterium]
MSYPKFDSSAQDDDVDTGRKILPWPGPVRLPTHRNPAVPLAAFIGRREGLPRNVIPFTTLRRRSAPPEPPAAA